jgi:hypothetical protein
MHFWLLIIIQFMFGGLLSTFLVFYFRSATLATAWPFMLLLAITFICNESFKKHYTRLAFQLSILFVSIYSFAIYILPIILHKIGPQIFLLSGIASLVLIGFFIVVLWYIAHERFRKSRNILSLSIAGIFCVINILYFTNLIPPLPLSLKDAGVYHSVIKQTDGSYEVAGEPTTFADYIFSTETFHYVSGNPVYIFTSVFSPEHLDTNVIHHWQHYDEIKKSWLTVSKVNVPIVGGRDGGYRTYSYKTVIQPRALAS